MYTPNPLHNNAKKGQDACDHIVFIKGLRTQKESSRDSAIAMSSSEDETAEELPPAPNLSPRASGSGSTQLTTLQQMSTSPTPSEMLSLFVISPAPLNTQQLPPSMHQPPPNVYQPPVNVQQPPQQVPAGRDICNMQWRRSSEDPVSAKFQYLFKLIYLFDWHSAEVNVEVKYIICHGMTHCHNLRSIIK